MPSSWSARGTDTTAPRDRAHKSRAHIEIWRRSSTTWLMGSQPEHKSGSLEGPIPGLRASLAGSRTPSATACTPPRHLTPPALPCLPHAPRDKALKVRDSSSTTQPLSPLCSLAPTRSPRVAELRPPHPRAVPSLRPACRHPAHLPQPSPELTPPATPPPGCCCRRRELAQQQKHTQLLPGMHRPLALLLLAAAAASLARAAPVPVRQGAWAVRGGEAGGGGERRAAVGNARRR